MSTASSVTILSKGRHTWRTIIVQSYDLEDRRGKTMNEVNQHAF